MEYASTDRNRIEPDVFSPLIETWPGGARALASHLGVSARRLRGYAEDREAIDREAVRTLCGLLDLQGDDDDPIGVGYGVLQLEQGKAAADAIHAATCGLDRDFFAELVCEDGSVDAECRYCVAGRSFGPDPLGRQPDRIDELLIVQVLRGSPAERRLDSPNRQRQLFPNLCTWPVDNVMLSAASFVVARTAREPERGRHFVQAFAEEYAEELLAINEAARRDMGVL